jgi:hypothetical protein
VFKPGDRVVYISAERGPDYGDVGIVLGFEDNGNVHVSFEQFRSGHKFYTQYDIPYTSGWVCVPSKLVLEEIYNSPLYQALREVD